MKSPEPAPEKLTPEDTLYTDLRAAENLSRADKIANGDKEKFYAQVKLLGLRKGRGRAQVGVRIKNLEYKMENYYNLRNSRTGEIPATVPVQEDGVTKYKPSEQVFKKLDKDMQKLARRYYHYGVSSPFVKAKQGIGNIGKSFTRRVSNGSEKVRNGLWSGLKKAATIGLVGGGVILASNYVAPGFLPGVWNSIKGGTPDGTSVT